MMFYGGPNPCFTWNETLPVLERGDIIKFNVTHFDAWLKVKDGDAYFDVFEGSLPGDSVNFNHKKARPAALIVKAFANYFPFLPTDNYLQNNGECIA